MRSVKRGCRRADPRSPVNCAALAFRADGRRSEVTVSDMSLSGLQVEGASFEDNDVFRLVIPHRGDINARIRWSSAGVAGAQFDDEVKLEDVVPAREEYAMRRVRTYTFGSKRGFGLKVCQ